MDQTGNINVSPQEEVQNFPQQQPLGQAPTSNPSVVVNTTPNLDPTDKGRESKTVLYIALFLFMVSLIFLGIYFVSAYKDNRVGVVVTATPQVEEKVEETVSPISTAFEEESLDEESEESTPSSTPKISITPTSSPSSFEDFSEIMR